jgi:DNA helicase II / ATP-dependent DNA helicase PcrA
LYRANHVSRSIEQSLIRENIPYTVFGGIRFFERREIKDVLAYLRLIVLGDDFSFLRVINTPSRGLGRKYIDYLSTIAEKQKITLLEALEQNIDEKELARKGAIDFIELIKKFKNRKEELKISDFIKEILDESGLTSFYRADGDTDRLDNIKELQSSIIILEQEDAEIITIENYLQEIALYTDLDLEDDNNDRVKLMTIHISKGLEFPYVFLCGFTEGILPSAMSIKERRARALEEERRLTYVAITRAEKGFYMTESEGYNFTTGMNKFPSRFLFEINENFFIRKGILSQEMIDEAKFQLKMEIVSQNIQKFKIGDIVIHPIWNKGKVIEVNEDKVEYQIEFLETNLIKPIIFEFKGLIKFDSTLKDKISKNKEIIMDNKIDDKLISNKPSLEINEVGFNDKKIDLKESIFTILKNLFN